METFYTMKFKQFRFVLVKGLSSSIVCHLEFNLSSVSRVLQFVFLAGSLQAQFLQWQYFISISP